MSSGTEEQRETLRLPLLGGALALAVAMGIGRFAYTPILPTMTAAGHLDIGRAGLLASSNYAGYLVGALAAAIVPRGAARNPILTACLLVVAATTGLMAGTTNFVAWSIIRFLSGLASAGVFVLASGAVLDVLRRRQRSSLSGWLYAGVGLGIAASGLVVRAATGSLGWRGDWLVLSILAAIAVYPSWRCLPRTSTSRTPPHQQPTRDSVPRVVLVLLLAAYLLEGAGYIVTGTFLVAIVERMPGLGGFGPSVWIVVGLAGVPSTILWAALAARTGYIQALALAYLAQACGIALPALAGGAGAAIASAILFGGTFMGISALTITYAGHLAPHAPAGLIGLLTAAFGLGQIIGPSLAAQLTTHTHSFGPALTVASVIVLAGGMLMIALNAVQPHGLSR